MNLFVYLIRSMPKTHPLKLPDFSVWIRIRMQMCIFLMGYACILLKASGWGSLLGPRIFLWPCILFYLSVFATPIASMFQIVVLGFIHDSVFNMPLGLSSLTWIFLYWFLAKQRRYLIKAPIHILWATFAGTICVVNIIEAFLLIKTNYAYSAELSTLEVMFQIGIFPFVLHFSHALLLRLGKFQ